MINSAPKMCHVILKLAVFCKALPKLLTLLQRGKFRPRLVELAGSNKPEAVESTTRKGFVLAKSGKLSNAVKTLSELKGIGPATASGKSLSVLNTSLFQ